MDMPRLRPVPEKKEEAAKAAVAAERQIREGISGIPSHFD
jgi:hypothetical protein